MMKQEEPSKDRRSNTDDTVDAEVERSRVIARVAREYWLYHRSRRSIATTLGVSKSTVSRLLAHASDLGVVDISVDDEFAVSGELHDGVARQLRDSFNLDDCSSISLRVREEYGQSDEERLHLALANHAGLHVKAGLGPGSDVCVSGGRAVYQAARMIAKQSRPRRALRVTSLCGRAWWRSWELQSSRTIFRPIDADDAAIALVRGDAQETGTLLHQVTTPLFADSASEAKRQMACHCRFLPDASWRDGVVPDWAIVGVGAVNLAGGHRFADLLRGGLHFEMSPQVRAATDQLRDSYDFACINGLPPFGDVGNRLFPSLPFPNQVLAERLDDLTAAMQEFNDRLTAINDRMVIANWRHLRGIRNVFAIAGGPLKLPALWTLLIVGHLVPEQRVISALCTDTGTAENLLQVLETYARQPASVQGWYRCMATRLFE